MTPAGIETATFRFLAQHLNHCATVVTQLYYKYIMNYINYNRNLSNVECESKAIPVIICATGTISE